VAPPGLAQPLTLVVAGLVGAVPVAGLAVVPPGADSDSGKWQATR